MTTKTAKTDPGFRVVAQGDTATVYLYGGIQTPDADGAWIDRDEFIAEVRAIKAEQIDVRIASIGGDMLAAGQMYQALVDHPARVRTIADGKAYSAGSMVLQAGDTRLANPMAMVMVHGPSSLITFGRGSAKDHREIADALDAHAEAMVPAYTRHGIDEGTVRGWLKSDEDVYFSAAQAQEANLVDEVIDITVAASAPESFRIAATGDAPPAATCRTETRAATMANENTSGNTAAGAPDDSGDFTAKHQRTLDAGFEKGVQAEKKRCAAIEAVFAPFYDGDELNPVTAAQRECLANVKCSELDAHRVLSQVLAKSTQKPVVAQQQYGMEQSYQAPPNASRHLGGASIGETHDEKRFGAYADAMAFAFGVNTEADKKGNDLVGLPMSELARAFARDVGMRGVEYADKDRIVAALLDKSVNARMAVGFDVMAAHSTGDFPGLLANVIDKQIRVMYEQVQETWRSVVRVGQVPDFKQASRPAMSAFDDLLMVPEGGEYKHGSMSDVVEYLQAKKYGRMVAFTREAIVNDDLQVFRDNASKIAMAANRKVGDDVWAIYTGNPTLNQDSTAVFAAGHANIGTAGAPATATLSEARRLMRVQKDPSGNATLGLSPSLLILPPTWETEGRALVSAEQLDYELADASSDALTNRRAANQFSNLQVVVEDRLGGADGTADDWFVQSNPQGPVPFIEVAFVRGQDAPQIESREGWSVDGIEYKVRMEYGVAALAYQCVVKNAGS